GAREIRHRFRPALPRPLWGRRRHAPRGEGVQDLLREGLERHGGPQLADLRARPAGPAAPDRAAGAAGRGPAGGPADAARRVLAGSGGLRGGRRQRAQRRRIVEHLAHLLERLRLDLADALRRDLELGGELVQRGRVLLAQPARLDDAAAARIERGERAGETLGPSALGLLRLEHAEGLRLAVGKVARRREAAVFLVIGLERDLAARK